MTVYPMPTGRLLTLLLVLTTALLGQACGFAPRGQQAALSVDAIPRPLLLSGLALDSPLRRELARQLRQSEVALTEVAAEAAAVLRLSEPLSASRLLSVDSRNKAVEYELTESVVVALLPADGAEPLLPPQRLAVTRIQYRPGDAILAGANEADILRAAMRRDLAGHILARLAAR
jgi:outer membrane lipopolysaccharide assembly protein LptE/RlpB